MCGSVIPGEWRKDIPSGTCSIWNHLQLEILHNKLRTLEKTSADFYERRKHIMAMECSTSTSLKIG